MYDSQELLRKYQNEIGIQMEPFEFMVYLPHKKVYLTIDKVKNSEAYKTISGSELRSILDRGEEIPKWYTYPDVANELKNQFPQSIKEDLLFFLRVFLIWKIYYCQWAINKTFRAGRKTCVLYLMVIL